MAILAADVAGSSRLVGANEEGTPVRWKAHWRELIGPKITEHRGRIVRITGEGLVVEFVSAIAAMRCAIELQRAFGERSSFLAAKTSKALLARLESTDFDLAVAGHQH